MERRFRALHLLAALFVCAILSPAQPASSPKTSPTEADSAAPITIGRSVVPLNGPWKFQIGDSPIDPITHAPLWAEPDFDDSNWETVDLTPKAGVVDPFSGGPGAVSGWTARGHPGYMGWAWYRLKVPIVVQKGAKLALDGPLHVDGGYQLFADGVLLGGFGDFRGPSEPPVVTFQKPTKFLLPLHPAGDSSNAPVVQTLVFRVWTGPLELNHFLEAGGLRYPPLLGELSAIESQYQFEWQHLFHVEAYSLCDVGLTLLLAIMAASLVLFDRSDRVYLWVAGVLLVTASSQILFLASRLGQLVSLRAFFLFAQAVATPLILGGWSIVWWIWFQVRHPKWVPKAIVVLTVLYMASEAIGGNWYTAVPHPIDVVFQTISLAVRLFSLALLVYIVGQGIRKNGRESWLVLPAVAPMAARQFLGELALLGMPVWYFAFGIRFQITDIGNLLLCMSFALLLLRRLLLSLRRQREMALDVKQAQEVQQVILPERRTVLPGMIVDCEFHPALEVGGDFFQVIPHPADGSLLIVAGDVTGKGLQAGMLVALLVGAIRTLAPFDPDPLSILAALNQRLCGRRQAHATCLALRIAANGEATLANAGHLPPYINGEPLEVEGSLPLGIVEHPEFSIANFFVAENDRLVLVSDGVVEATNDQNQLFGFERLQELLTKAATAADIAAAAKRFGQQDDISVISVSRTALRERALAQNPESYTLSSETS
jgi:Stage II sporulation protein E (SpoIIE)